MADSHPAASYFLSFAEVARPESPLYFALATAIADDAELLALTDEMMEHQPPPNVLLGAVHFLMLRGAHHELSEYFASVGGGRQPDGYEIVALRDFCDVHRDDLLPLLRRGRVQTNEVRRATFLVPGFAWVAAQAKRPLATIEVGTAAGLLTLWDRYGYDYGQDRVVGESPLTLSCELRGGVPDLELPPCRWSAGIDIEPVHVEEEDARDWLRALVWPDQPERMERLESAISIARDHPPRLVKGDGIDSLAGVVADAPADAALVVHHSFSLNQVSAEERDRFDGVLGSLSAERDIYLVAVDWVGSDDHFELRAGQAQADGMRRTTLARVHHHGAWLDWVA
ncbi:MAG: DUF2332 domain-containing protein [Acidimicrobiia bacterium]